LSSRIKPLTRLDYTKQCALDTQRQRIIFYIYSAITDFKNKPF